MLHTPTAVPRSQHDRWKRISLAITATYALLLFSGTHISEPERILGKFSLYDKSLHFLAYAGLGFLVAWSWSLRRPFTWRSMLLLGAGLALFGALDEISQIPVGRFCDALDWAADSFGILAGGATLIAARRLLTANNSAWEAGSCPDRSS